MDTPRGMIIPPSTEFNLYKSLFASRTSVLNTDPSSLIVTPLAQETPEPDPVLCFNVPVVSIANPGRLSI